MKKAADSINQDNYLDGNLSISDYPKIESSNTEIQQRYILKVIHDRGSANTIELKYLGINHPCGRVKELRHKGVNIQTSYESYICHAGIKHRRVARYFLSVSNDSDQMSLFEFTLDDCA